MLSDHENIISKLENLASESKRRIENKELLKENEALFVACSQTHLTVQ